MSDMRKCIDDALDRIEAALPEILRQELADLDFMNLTAEELTRSRLMRECAIRRHLIGQMFDMMYREITQGGEVRHVERPEDATIN